MVYGLIRCGYYENLVLFGIKNVVVVLLFCGWDFS